MIIDGIVKDYWKTQQVVNLTDQRERKHLPCSPSSVSLVKLTASLRLSVGGKLLLFQDNTSLTATVDVAVSDLIPLLVLNKDMNGASDKKQEINQRPGGDGGEYVASNTLTETIWLQGKRSD